MVGAETISPLFPFSFYGHVVDGFYITTHGFLSLFPRLHDYIYKTQYIAPLGSKLDPSRSNSFTISVLSLPDRLTVEWSNVSVIAEAEHPTEVRPVLTTAALYDHQPAASISDAFLLHGTVAIFSALPTCVAQTSCNQYSDLRQSSNFSCVWCEAAGHCSDGADRKREHWDTNE